MFDAEIDSHEDEEPLLSAGYENLSTHWILPEYSILAYLRSVTCAMAAASRKREALNFDQN